MAERRNKKLKFNKNKTVDDNYQILKNYILNLDGEFGNILIDGLKDDENDIRQKIKNDIINIINE